MAKSDQILIVGAGPTGLTAAVELARYGFRPRVIDRGHGPTPLSKAVGLSAGSLELLEPSGVAAKLLDQGIKIRRGGVWYEGDRLGTIDFSSLPHRYNFLLALPQSETETILADVLADFGVKVERCTTLSALKQSGGEIEASIDGPDGRTGTSFEFVFGADGLDSTVRRQAGLRFDGYTHRRVWSIADVILSDWPYERHSAQLFLDSRGEISFVIAIGQSRFRIISNTKNGLSHLPGHYFVERVLRSGQFLIPVKQARRYQNGRVFLGGDAAHVHSPVGARGMNLGIEDAVSFVARLISGSLGGYTAERYPIGRCQSALNWDPLSACKRDPFWGSPEAMRGAVGVAQRIAGGRCCGMVRLCS